MLRIYKNISRQSGAFNKVNNRIDFQEFLAEGEVIDNSRSYLDLTTGVTGYSTFDGFGNLPNGSPDPVFAWYFGENQPDFGLISDNVSERQTSTDKFRGNWTNDVKYSPSSIVMHSRLDSFTKGNLESNRDINFLRETLRYYLKNDAQNSSDTWKGWGYDVNSTLGNFNRNANQGLQELDKPYGFHFGKINFFGNLPSTQGNAHVIVPLSDIFQLGKEEMSYKLGRLDTHIELDNKNQILAEWNKYPGNLHWGEGGRAINGQDCVNVNNAVGGFADVVMTADNNGYIAVGDWVILTANYDDPSSVNGNSFLNRLQVTAVGGAGNRTLSFGLIQAFPTQLNAVGDIALFTNVTVTKYNGSVAGLDSRVKALNNYVYIANNQNTEYPPDNAKFFVGQQVCIEYNSYDNNLISSNRVTRIITDIRQVAGGLPIPAVGDNPLGMDPYREYTRITVNGAPLPQAYGFYAYPLPNPLVNPNPDPVLQVLSTAFIWAPKTGTRPSFTVEEAEMVVWKRLVGVQNALVNQSLMYQKLMVEVQNRTSTTRWDKTYNLPMNTQRFLFLNKLTSLISNDRNLESWRMYLDQNPTVYTEVVQEGTLSLDRIIQWFGSSLRSLSHIPRLEVAEEGFKGVCILPELNRTTNPAPMLDIRQTARRVNSLHPDDPEQTGNLESSLVYLYSMVISKVDM